MVTKYAAVNTRQEVVKGRNKLGEDGQGGGYCLYSIEFKLEPFIRMMEEKDELHQDYMKKRMNSSYSSNRPGGK